MKPATQRKLLRTLGFLTLPLFCLTCLFACSIVNPMGISFLSTFEIVNSSSEDLRVTPIGAQGKEGRRNMLPISASQHLYLITPVRSDFLVKSGSTLSLTYDWDDIQFSEIICERTNGSRLVFPTGLHPTQGQYRQPPTRRFEISGLDSLQPASELHLQALRSRGRLTNVYTLAVLGLASPYCFWLARRMRFD